MTKQLVSIIEAHGLQTGTTKEVGALVVLLAATLPVSSGQHRDLLMEHILAGKLATNDQVAAAVKHVKARTDGNVDRAALEKAAGVGVVITDADVAGAVSEVMAANKAAICEERYRFNLNKLIQPVKAVGDMVWADIGKVKAELDVQAAAMLGPKTAEDEKPAEKPKKTKAPKARINLVMYATLQCLSQRCGALMQSRRTQCGQWDQFLTAWSWCRRLPQSPRAGMAAARRGRTRRGGAATRTSSCRRRRTTRACTQRSPSRTAPCARSATRRSSCRRT